MNGVVILRTYQAISDGWTMLLILIELTIIPSGIIICANLALDNQIKKAIGVAAITLFLSILLIVIWPRVKRYEVLLQDGVSWREFTDHYEVLSVDGNILKVRDRTGE